MGVSDKWQNFGVEYPFNILFKNEDIWNDLYQNQNGLFTDIDYF